MQKDYDHLIKAILVGDTKVGKSCILGRLSDDKFHEEHNATIGVEFGVCYSPDGLIKFQVWDTAGEERFRAITRSYYRGALLIMLVFDLSSRESLESLQKTFLSDIQSLADHTAQYLLIGNKSDLPRQITSDEAESWALQNNCFYLEMSAKDTLRETAISKLEEVANKFLA